MNNLYIVIPTLNPDIDIFNIFLESLRKEFKNIVIYNDGCEEDYDSYFKKLEKEGIIVLKHHINMGKGRALKDSFNYLLNTYPDIKGVVTADSDGQHSVKDISKCAKLVLKYPNALILGCRDFDKKSVPLHNKLGNKCTREVFSILLGLKITDTQTGLRGLSSSVMEKYLTTTGERFEYETQQLIDTIEKDIDIKEVRIETIYMDDKSQSHFKVVKDSIKIYKLFIKYFFASVSSFIVDITLFTLFIGVISGNNSLIVCTILARIISGIYNYLVNYHIVFKKKKKHSFIKYVLLCIVQMLVSAFSLQLIDNLFNSNIIFLKIIIDLVIFIINYLIQKHYIFGSKKKEEK